MSRPGGRYRLHDRVALLGHIPDAEKYAWYANALAVAYPPYDEDYGYVTLEAMLSAKPVITCADSGGTAGIRRRWRNRLRGRTRAAGAGGKAGLALRAPGPGRPHGPERPGSTMPTSRSPGTMWCRLCCTVRDRGLSRRDCPQLESQGDDRCQEGTVPGFTVTVPLSQLTPNSSPSRCYASLLTPHVTRTA